MAASPTDIPTTDLWLMQKAGNGDRQAYRELVRRHLSRCVRIAERMLGNRSDAEDVAQDACLALWREAPHWQARAKVSTWLYRVVVNACIDRLRKVVPLTGLDMDTLYTTDIAPDDVMANAQDAARVQQALARLPERQRAALVLSYYENLSNEEAARVMHVPLGAFQQLLFRARQNMRSALADHFKENRSWIPQTM